MHTLVTRAQRFLPVVFFAMVVLFGFGATPAHAQWDEGDTSGTYDGGGCCSYDSSPTYYDTYTPSQSYYDTYTPSQNYYDTYTPSYDTSYSTPSYSDYSSPSYGSSYGGYSSPSYSSYTPSYSAGYSGYSVPSFTMPHYAVTTPVAPSVVANNGNTYDSGNTVITNTNNTNNNTCTSPNSCNTTNNNNNSSVINNSTPIIYTPTYQQQPVVYTQPTYQPTPVYVPTPTYTPTYNYAPTCQMTLSQPSVAFGQAATLSWSGSYIQSGFISGLGNVGANGSMQVTPGHNLTYTGTFTGTNGQTVTCSASIIVNTIAQPYVTLSAVPYTGLDLGPAGTALYWGFLVLWCLFAAYLIVVKRAHLSIARRAHVFLFGSDDTEEEEETTEATQPAVAAPIMARKEDAIDDFILRQVYRAQA